MEVHARVRATAATLFVGLLGVGRADAQLFNPTFDVDASHWVVGGLASLTYDPTLGSPAPGSGKLLNYNTEEPFAESSISQCRPASPGARYYGGALVRFPAAESTNGSTYFRLSFHSATNCDGCGGSGLGSLAGTGRNPAIDGRGVWLASNVGTIDAGVTAPGGTQAACIKLVAVKDSMSGERTVSIDSVVFAPEGSPPIAVLFVDGFETGTTEFWSVP
jgi:hypothetical protein